jgi:hypothetical protein
METAQESYRRMLRDHIAPGLRQLGFKGSGKSYRLPNDAGYNALIDFQASRHSTKSTVEFTVNLAVWHPRATEDWAEAQREWPNACVFPLWGQWSARLNDLAPQTIEQWEKAEPSSPMELVAEKVLDAIREHVVGAMQREINRPMLTPGCIVETRGVLGGASSIPLDGMVRYVNIGGVRIFPHGKYEDVILHRLPGDDDRYLSEVAKHRNAAVDAWDRADWADTVKNAVTAGVIACDALLDAQLGRDAGRNGPEAVRLLQECGETRPSALLSDLLQYESRRLENSDAGVHRGDASAILVLVRNVLVLAVAVIASKHPLLSV